MRPYNQQDNEPIFVHSGGWYARMIQRQREMEFIFTIVFNSLFFVANVIKNVVAPFKQTQRVLGIGREINEYDEELEVIGVLDSELRKHVHLIGGTGQRQDHAPQEYLHSAGHVGPRHHPHRSKR